MSLINCEISFNLTWSPNCVIYDANRETTFPVVTLSFQDNAELLQQS